MEQRLIDAFALISEMEDKCCGECDLCIYRRYENACYFCGLIETAPTVAVDNYSMGYQDGVRKVLSERPKGKWIEYHSGYHCSVCDQYSASGNFKFCFGCGADMRGEEDVT